MKLILCLQCTSVMSLKYEPVTCGCAARSGGVLESDGDHAQIWGEWVVPVCMDNNTLARAALNRPMYGDGLEFKAWVPCTTSPKFKKVEHFMEGKEPG